MKQEQISKKLEEQTRLEEYARIGIKEGIMYLDFSTRFIAHEGTPERKKELEMALEKVKEKYRKILDSMGYEFGRVETWSENGGANVYVEPKKLNP